MGPLFWGKGDDRVSFHTGLRPAETSIPGGAGFRFFHHASLPPAPASADPHPLVFLRSATSGIPADRRVPHQLENRAHAYALGDTLRVGKSELRAMAGGTGHSVIQRKDGIVIESPPERDGLRSRGLSEGMGTGGSPSGASICTGLPIGISGELFRSWLCNSNMVPSAITRAQKSLKCA
jgi:hypothetical protein